LIWLLGTLWCELNQGGLMQEKRSRAKSIKAFIDRLEFPSAKSGHNIMQVIGASFKLKPDSANALLLVHSQVENFEKLLLEIELSGVGEEAKDIYRSHIRGLSKLVAYPALYGNAESARVDIIKPNYATLTLLSDALGIYYDYGSDVQNELADAIDKLEIILRELSEGDLDSQIKGVVLPQISSLIFLLKNCDVLGFDRAWEVASASMMTLYKRSQGEVAEKDKRILQRLAVRVTLVVGILASADAGIKHISSVVSQAKGLYEFIVGAESASVPKIEYKKPDQKVATAD
jgi:hypothetical protein